MSPDTYQFDSVDPVVLTPMVAGPLHGSGGAFASEGFNPLASCAHIRRQSRYLGHEDGSLVHLLDRAVPVAEGERSAYEALSAKVLAEDYPCVMARSIFSRPSVRMGSYGVLGAPATTAVVCHDLYEFAREFPAPADEWVSFVAMFSPMGVNDESSFETLLWRQLRAMHDIDRQFFGWSAEVSDDPADPRFAFSIGGRAYFLVGMHPRASRMARQAALPIVVFNLHEQFERLRDGGQYERVRDKIRARDFSLQGSINPMLSGFGERSESREYSGRSVGADWRCPFEPRPDYIA